MISSVSVSPPPVDPEIQQVIDDFNSLDLHRNALVFQRWLDYKKERKRAESRQRSTPPSQANRRSSYPSSLQSHCSSSYTACKRNFLNHSYTPQELQKLSPGEIKDLVDRAQRNRMAFEKWIQKKEQLEIQRLQKQALENAENERRLAQEEQKLLERNQRKQDTLRQWAKSKNATREAEEAARQQKENEERKRLQDKKTKSEEAFLKWKAQKGKPGAISKDHVYHHSRAWVDTAVPNAADEPSPNSLRSLSSKENILSPPHMYNEYNKYTIQAPEFLKRYRAQVASAGIPPPSLPIRRKYKSGSLPKLNKVPISK